MTATEVWDYDAGQTIFSAVCSARMKPQCPGFIGTSVYLRGVMLYWSPKKTSYKGSSRRQSLLGDYAVASNGTEALLVGLD